MDAFSVSIDDAVVQYMPAYIVPVLLAVTQGGRHLIPGIDHPGII